MAPPLGELSPKVTERVLRPCIPSPSSLRSATSPIGGGKGGGSIIPLCRLTVWCAHPIGTDGFLLWRKGVLRCGDGELGAVGKENVVYLRKINGFII